MAQYARLQIDDDLSIFQEIEQKENGSLELSDKDSEDVKEMQQLAKQWMSSQNPSNTSTPKK